MLWTDFLNSEWHDWRGSGRTDDRLDNPQWLKEFLETWKLDAPVPPDAGELAALKEFRGCLRSQAERLVSGTIPSDANLRELNRVMAGGPVIRQISHTAEGRQLDLLPFKRDWAQVMAEIAASFALTLVEGEGARVRVCANPDCLWVFYDDTRNRNKRFCDDKSCGNLMKVRRFRARHQGSTGQPGPGPEGRPDGGSK
ncbi:MAG: CGNR zinc finger domain-containing protein [Firmicutes bacterium]|nr:CGNR zinc finger domain-containing protein [Bacillota bacterium]